MQNGPVRVEMAPFSIVQVRMPRAQSRGDGALPSKLGLSEQGQRGDHDDINNPVPCTGCSFGLVPDERKHRR